MDQARSTQLFTRGLLFEAVQSLRLFPDSKTFPDMVPRKFDLTEENTEEILEGFAKICEESFLNPIERFAAGLATTTRGEHAGRLDRFGGSRGLGESLASFRSRLKDFVDDHFQKLPTRTARFSKFELPGLTLEAYIDAEWDALRRDPASMPPAAFQGTLMKLDYPYVVAGGRFDEVFYWDAYFTAEGLALSKHVDLVKDIVRNQTLMIRRLGFIPNGSRTYFATRSQAPFYHAMLDLLARHGETEFVEQARVPDGQGGSIGLVEMLEDEHKFWMDQVGTFQGRVVTLENGLVLNRYWDHFRDESAHPRVQPRPEAYYEDIATFTRSGLKTDQEAETLYRHLRASAESGWDFCSRWFRPIPDDQGVIRRELHTIRTTEILPVDLNALLFAMETSLHRWTGKPEYKQVAERRKRAIIETFWNEEHGWFFDYSREDRAQTDVWSLAGAYPLFAKLLDPEDPADKTRLGRMIATLRDSDRFLKEGGVVSTLLETGEQWDSPNGWAPLQWVVIRGLLNYGERDLAREIARRFVACVGITYERHGRIMEKYNVCDPAVIAGGGEYAVQDGFGWTNGVVKALIHEFRREWNEDPMMKGLME
ncbi:trehalase family glycosidase [Aquisphaera insulae]|uniref:trehalase family glycosidase n=1 Tax=Aquisphaera insulae TaxID=2712864 RepID=UPI0013EC0B0B|nr:trehalase family glycosidase [Aquisphaera insulae]